MIDKYEIAFIKGLIKSWTYTGSLFAFFSNEYFPHLTEFFSKRLPNMEKGVQRIYDTAYSLWVDFEDPKIVKMVKDEEAVCNSKFTYDIILRTWIKLWFQERLIVQVKRPETYGNSGDYVGFDGEKDTYFAKNRLFIKFNDKSEYEEYLESFNNEESYTSWYERNEKNLTTITI